VKVKQRKRVAYSLVALSFAAVIWAFTQQVPYVVQKPGGVANVLGKYERVEVIQIEGIEREDTFGTLDTVFVTVVGSPNGTFTIPELIPYMFSKDSVVLPLEEFYPPGFSEDDLDNESAQYMADAQKAAVNYVLSKVSPELRNRVKLKISLGEVGGPSGGLMFALGAYELLTPDTLTGGKRIAGTGTIDDQGLVGPIGGIQQKLWAAYYDGDKFFLAPKENCDEVVDHVPTGLRVIPVGTFDEALKVVQTIGSDGDVSKFPVCTLG
jgi:PDZ domain-containing protein